TPRRRPRRARRRACRDPRRARAPRARAAWDRASCAWRPAVTETRRNVGGVSSGERFLAAFHNTYRLWGVTKLTAPLRRQSPLAPPLALRDQSDPPYNAGHDPDSSMACSRRRASVRTAPERSPARVAGFHADPHARDDREKHPGG